MVTRPLDVSLGIRPSEDYIGSVPIHCTFPEVPILAFYLPSGDPVVDNSPTPIPDGSAFV